MLRRVKTGRTLAVTLSIPSAANGTPQELNTGFLARLTNLV
jgi:hypothetical protein